MTTWFTSDTHILHENIVHNLGEGRPFHNMNHMLTSIRNNWVENVQPDDIIYHLGDMAMGNFEESIEFFRDLPGKKKFVPGNHDKIFSGTNNKTRMEMFTPLYESVGFEILPENTSIKVDVSWGTQEVLLSHFPYTETWYDREGIKDKYAKNRPVNEGLPLIHGHTHSKERFSPNPLEFHVGVDANGFTPVSVSEIVIWLESLRTASVI
jgi:calcineurin-like phosphoesterase family protein